VSEHAKCGPVHAHDCHQNVTEPRATEYCSKSTHM